MKIVNDNHLAFLRYALYYYAPPRGCRYYVQHNGGVPSTSIWVDTAKGETVARIRIFGDKFGCSAIRGHVAWAKRMTGVARQMGFTEDSSNG